MPTTVLFDLDGTLVDTVPFILSSVRAAFDGRADGPTDAQWLEGIGQPLRVQLRAFAADEADVEALVERYRAHQRANHDAMTRCFPGALELVRTLAAEGHRIGIVTSKMGEPARRTVRHVGLEPFVEVLVAADSCPRHKPDPEPVRLALTRLGVPAEAALFVGDSPHDVTAGRGAGVTTAGVTWGAASRAVLEGAGAHHVVESFPALGEIARGGLRLG